MKLRMRRGEISLDIDCLVRAWVQLQQFYRYLMYIIKQLDDKN